MSALVDLAGIIGEIKKYMPNGVSPSAFRVWCYDKLVHFVSDILLNTHGDVSTEKLHVLIALIVGCIEEEIVQKEKDDESSGNDLYRSYKIPDKHYDNQKKGFVWQINQNGIKESMFKIVQDMPRLSSGDDPSTLIDAHLKDRGFETTTFAKDSIVEDSIAKVFSLTMFQILLEMYKNAHTPSLQTQMALR